MWNIKEIYFIKINNNKFKFTTNMKLKRFLLRYHPPGIILEYLRKSGDVETKSIDLLNLTPE